MTFYWDMVYNFHKKTKFHKVVRRHYSGEVENVCSTM